MTHPSPSAKTGPKERPILFSGPMVRAILEGSKTQTRRVVQGRHGWIEPIHEAEPIFVYEHGVRCQGGCDYGCRNIRQINCPFGHFGDRLWVRETWRKWRLDDPDSKKIVYRESFIDAVDPGFWKPSIHMPRWASRITLEIVQVRVERLQEISEEDARAEGFGDIANKVDYNARTCFLHGDWALPKLKENPWVWVIEFKRVDA